jgi:hypothetical protein
MPGYITLTTARATVPDGVALNAAIQAATGDPTAVLTDLRDGNWRGKKAAPWSAAHTAVAQSALDTGPAITTQLVAQRNVDNWPIEYRALVLALIDQLNIIRAALPSPLGAITPTQAIAAVRAKAATLS